MATPQETARQALVQHALARGFVDVARAGAALARDPGALLDALSGGAPAARAELERVQAAALALATPRRLALDPGALRAGAVEACRRAAEADPTFVPTVDLALEVLGELGRGGMGVVHRVRDRRLGRQAALKRVVGAEPRLAARLEREALVTARLDHPSIPPVYEAGADAAGRPFMLMRVVEGGSLERAIRDLHAEPSTRAQAGARPSLPPAGAPATRAPASAPATRAPAGAPATRAQASAPATRAPGLRALRPLLDALARAGEAVAYAHARGVVHRDLKPANVMLGRFGEVLVMDWGLARVVGVEDERETLGGGAPARPASGPHGAEHTLAGDVLGTPGYMPPEQAGGEVVDARADVFALGAMLVEVLTGRPPIEGPTAINRIHATLTGAIARPRDRRPELPADLDAIAARALAPQVDQRTPSAERFVDELRAWLAGDEVPGHAYDARERAARWARRHPARLVGATLGALVLAALFALGAVAAQARASAASAEAARERALLADAEARAATERERAAEAARVAADVKATAAAEREAASEERAREARDRRERERKASWYLQALIHAGAPARPDRLIAGVNEVVDADPAGPAAPLAIRLLANRGLFEQALPLQRRHIEALGADAPVEALWALYRLESGTDPELITPTFERVRALIEVTHEYEDLLSVVRAHHANAQRRYVDALQVVDEAIRTRRGSIAADLLLEQAHALFALGEHERALSALQGLHAEFPNDAICNDKRAIVLLALRRPAEAKRAAEHAIDFAPWLASAWLHVGMAGRAIDPNDPEVVLDLRRAVELGDLFARHVLAKVHVDRGEDAEARRELDALLGIQPDHVEGLLLRGDVRARVNDAAGAAADWSRALELAPQHPRAASLRQRLGR